jgi:hypothetical protein
MWLIPDVCSSGEEIVLESEGDKIGSCGFSVFPKRRIPST